MKVNEIAQVAYMEQSEKRASDWILRILSLTGWVKKQNLRKNGCVYMHNWITWLYSRNYLNIVNQLYFNKTFKNEKKKKEDATKEPEQWGHKNILCLSPQWSQRDKYLKASVKLTNVEITDKLDRKPVCWILVGRRWVRTWFSYFWSVF